MDITHAGLNWIRDLRDMNNILAMMVVGTVFLLGLMVMLDTDIFGAESNNSNITIVFGNNNITEYLNEMKFSTCHVTFDIYNLTEYYRCIGQ